MGKWMWPCPIQPADKTDSTILVQFRQYYSEVSIVFSEAFSWESVARRAA